MSSLVELEKQQVFFPLQPEFNNTMENYIEHKPLNCSRDQIILYYQFDAPPNAIHSFPIIPDGCYDTIFCCCGQNHTSFLLTSPSQRKEEYELHHVCKYFGVRFLPKQNIFQLKSTLKEMLNKQIPLLDAITITPDIFEKIATASNFYERIKIFDRLVYTQTNKLNKQEIVEHCLNKIYLFKGKIGVNQLVEDIGFSDRYIRKLFEAYVGFTPKEFSEIIRFQHSLAMILDDNYYNMLEIAYENGYHDQAHFIKNFKKHALMSPNKYKKALLYYKDGSSA